MNNASQRSRFLNVYRSHLRNELDKMAYGQVSQNKAKETSEPLDPLSSTIAIAAVLMMITSIFLV